MRVRLAFRFTTITLVTLIAVVSFASLNKLVRGDERPPNIIMILTDDQGYGDMSCHGNPVLKTPAIDALHRESIRLTNFHVDPTCSPTRAALMTGRYSTRVGVWLTYMGRHHLRRDETTIADVFQENGYQTAIFGKWHLGDNYPFRPNDRGFDESLIHGGGVVGEAPDFWGNDYYDDAYLRNGKLDQVNGYCTDIWFDEAIKFADLNRDEPFFVYLPTNAPHGPLNVPEKYVRPYRKLDIPHARSQFYGCIANIDENIGRLRQRLEELGLDGNTILIFLTDNGTATGFSGRRDGYPINGFNAGMRGRKGTAYEGGHRAACFIHWPAGKIGGDLQRARDIDQLTAHIDLFPTLVDLCGLKRNDKTLPLDGRSLLPLLNNSTPAETGRTLFVHHQGRFGQTVKNDRPIKFKHYSVMTKQWRMVGHESTIELYDIEKDPAQRKNLSDSYPTIVRQLSQQYEQWWTDVTHRSDTFARTVIGSPHQSVTKLTCQQWHSPRSPYNQYHVRNGMETNGFVDLDVESAGRYHIELRRWPREFDQPMNALVHPPSLDPDRVDAKNKNLNLPGKSFEFVHAKLKIGDVEMSRPISPESKSVTFVVELDKGPTNLQSWLIEEDGTSVGAYYVYITKQ